MADEASISRGEVPGIFARMEGVRKSEGSDEPSAGSALNSLRNHLRVERSSLERAVGVLKEWEMLSETSKAVVDPKLINDSPRTSHGTGEEVTQLRDRIRLLERERDELKKENCSLQVIKFPPAVF